MDWALWFYWIMATTLGWLLGNLLLGGVPVVAAGIAIAGLQWAVVYKRFKDSWKWFLFSAAGWVGGYVLFVFFSLPELNFVLGPWLGASTGIAQWLLLKEETDWSGWWIPISILAWTSGLTLLPGLLTSGALPGALTGLALTILIGYSSKQKLRRGS